MYVTLREFLEKYNKGWPSERAMRHLIRKTKYGNVVFKDAFKWVGKRVLINDEKFWEIIEKGGYK